MIPAALAALVCAQAAAAPGPLLEPSALVLPARDYQSKVLGNGLTVVVVEDHALPLVTVEIGVRNGSMAEPPEYNGLSHLYEHMFFKGNRVLPNQEAFLEKTRELGMVFNGSTETERVNYFFTTSADKLRPSLAMLRDSAESPLFDPAELAREQQVVIGEIDRDEADPFFQFTRQMDLALWKYPSFKDPLGNRQTVAASTPEMMRLIQSRFYVPNNSLLVIAGDVAPDAAFGLAEELLGAWPRAADPFVAHPVVTEPPLSGSRVVVALQPVQTVALGFEWHGPSVQGDEIPFSYAADLLSTIVGQPGSRFQRDLVDSGACVRADFSWFTQAHVGPVSYGVEAAPDRVDACLKAALAELPRLLGPDAYTDQEMRNAMTQLEVRRAMERESTSSYAHVLSFFWSSTGLSYYDGYLSSLRAVTRGQIDAYLRRYILGEAGAKRPLDYVFGVLLSPELAKAKGYDAGHFEKLLGLRGSK